MEVIASCCAGVSLVVSEIALLDISGCHCCCCCCQVIDYYRSKVVKLEAERAPEEVSRQIREALSKVEHNDD